MSDDPKPPEMKTLDMTPAKPTPLNVLGTILTEVQPFATDEQLARQMMKYGPLMVAAIQNVVQVICDERDKDWLDAINVRLPAAMRERIVIPMPRRLM